MASRISHSRKLSAQAKILWALVNNQLLSRNELCKKAGIHQSTLYRHLPLLKVYGIIKEVDGKYALSTYNNCASLRTRIDEALKSFKEENYTQVSILDLANRVGAPPKDVEDYAFALARKCGIKIGKTSETFRPEYRPVIL